MTIGMWIIAAIGAIILIGGIVVGPLAFKEGETGFGFATIFVSLLLGLAMIIGPIVYSNTEAGERKLKDQQSNFNGGITRTVKVYDIDGELIESYEGKFDIETDKTSYILFDDDAGKRHIIYYTTGTIIVDEK